MGARRTDAVRQRLEELETASDSHLLESSLRPLSKPRDPSSVDDLVAVPVDLLLTRFKNLDRGLSSLRKRLHRHEEALRRRVLIEWIGTVVLVVATALITTGLPRVFAHSHATAEKVAEKAAKR